MEIFPHFAVGFRWNDQDASRARIFSWSEDLSQPFSIFVAGYIIQTILEAFFLGHPVGEILPCTS